MVVFHQGPSRSTRLLPTDTDNDPASPLLALLALLALQSLASMTGDLSSMTAPPFILSPTSLTEFPAYWGERPELFADIAQGKDEQERAERVLRWFICTLKGQYTVSPPRR